MKVLIATDSFKESLTSLQAATAMETGIKKVFPNSEIIKVPMADGGEGTVQALIDATGGELIKTMVISPLGEKVKGFFGVSGDKQIAFIEMAAASGLALIPVEERNPCLTTSYGTGELIKEALDQGVKKIILGLGGSGTNDGGVGMLQALGAQCVDKVGKDILPGGEHLLDLAHISLKSLDPRLQNVQIDVACDVDNPLCGPNGASAIFGPQKGATATMVQTLDEALLNFADIVEQDLGIKIQDVSGAGAAGGMGAGLLILPKVRLESGVDIVIEATGLIEKAKDVDVVITGEGQMDAQTIYGKTPIGVAKTAKKWSKPVIAIVGSVKEDYGVVYDYGIDAVFPSIRQVTDIQTVLKHAEQNLISCAQNVAKLYQITP